jgi:YD repeat-containing protein
MAAVWWMYGYQDYPAPEPPVCAFKVRSGAQLKDFIQQKEVTDLQIYYNRPDVIDNLEYAEFFKKYNTSSELPKYYYNNLNQVILKVENYTTSLNIPDVPNLSDACAFINLYPNTLITIFKYDSITNQLVSVVSSNCQTTYYTYDALHQLKWIKDNEGNIIQEFDHNYKPQN